jgi:hypothetical protein
VVAEALYGLCGSACGIMQRWSEGISDGRAPPCSDLHCPSLHRQVCRQGQCEAEQGGRTRAVLAGVASYSMCLLGKLQVLHESCVACGVVAPYGVVAPCMHLWSEGISGGRAPLCSAWHCPFLRRQACRQGQCEAEEQGGRTRAVLAGAASNSMCLLSKLRLLLTPCLACGVVLAASCSAGRVAQVAAGHHPAPIGIVLCMDGTSLPASTLPGAAEWCHLLSRSATSIAECLWLLSSCGFKPVYACMAGIHVHTLTSVWLGGGLHQLARGTWVYTQGVCFSRSVLAP